MKNTLLTLSIFLYSTFAFAQITYYKDLDSNKRCQELKDELYTLLNKNVSVRDFEEAFNFMSNYDLYYVGTAGYIWDIYSYNPNGAQPYTYKPNDKCGGYSGEGYCWNREHVFPDSWFSAASPMTSDIINLLPADGFVNGKRGNVPYGNVSTSSFTSQNGSKFGTGTIPTIVGNYFEPIDEFKGDVARVFLYMSVRYQDLFKTWENTDFTRVYGQDPLKGFKDEYLQVLLAWHKLDPPSDKEKARNTRIEAYQGNRNPFVDYPQFVEYIWETNNCKAVGIKNYVQNSANLYPNPATNEISLSDFTAKDQRYFITDISGKMVSNGVLSQSKLSVHTLDNGTYFLFITENELTSYSKFIIAR